LSSMVSLTRLQERVVQAMLFMAVTPFNFDSRYQHVSFASKCSVKLHSLLTTLQHAQSAAPPFAKVGNVTHAKSIRGYCSHEGFC